VPPNAFPLIRFMPRNGVPTHPSTRFHAVNGARASRVAASLLVALMLAGGDLAAQCAPDTVAAASPTPFTDSRTGFGSAALVAPGAMLLNRGMSTLVYASTERRLGSIRWAHGGRSVQDALAHPVAAIERSGGWGRWFRHEFASDSWNVWTWAWTANYGGHVLAGGITYRVAAEWFAQRGVPHPRLTGAVFTWGLGLVNEVLESQHHERGMATTVGGLYVFEPLGILLFSFDGVARFFGDRLEAADWSPQAAVTFPDGAVRNVAQVISYKVPLPFTRRAKLLFLIGQISTTGLQVEMGGGYALGGTVGFAGQDQVVDPTTSFERLVAQTSGGLYLSRTNSLLASAVVGQGSQPLALNLYPGVLPGRLRDFGIWLTVQEDGPVSFGFSSQALLGVSLGMDAGGRGPQR